jgi:hypothetical protein
VTMKATVRRTMKAKLTIIKTSRGILCSNDRDNQ